MIGALAKVVQTCPSHPSQWDAWDTNGNYYYLRYRFGRGTVDTYETPDDETWTTVPDGGVARFEQGNDYDGEITLGDFLTAAGLELAPGAVLIGTPTAEQYSFAREWFATQPPKIERAARERRRREILRYRWPTAAAVKTSYHRRRSHHDR